MRSHSNRVVSSIESHELRLEHDISVDLQVALNGLDTSETSYYIRQYRCARFLGLEKALTLTSSIHRGEVDIRSSHSSHVGSSNIDLQIRQDSITRECNTSDSLVVYCAGDLAVVCVDDCWVDQHEGGSGVGNGLATGDLHRRSGTDSELLGGELPETLGVVDWRPGEGAVELGGVNVAEFVSTDSVVTEIGSEDWFRERGHRIVEECFLLLWLDGVEFGESETDESVVRSILYEGS